MNASEKAFSNTPLTFETATKSTLDKIKQIPIYITTTEGTASLTDIQKDSISKVIADSYNEASAVLDCGITQCSIMRLSDEQKNNLLASPIFGLLFKQFEKDINNGVKIKYINIYVPSTALNLANASTQSTQGNADDISYWESNCSYLGTYNGYKFLKKKVISLGLAVLLICAMAIPAAAATFSDTGDYTGSTGTCSYHA